MLFPLTHPLIGFFFFFKTFQPGSKTFERKMFLYYEADFLGFFFPPQDVEEIVSFLEEMNFRKAS